MEEIRAALDAGTFAEYKITTNKKICEILGEVVDNEDSSENNDEGNSKDGESEEKDQVVINEKQKNELLNFINNM